MQSCLKSYVILSLLLQKTCILLIFAIEIIRLFYMTTTIIILLSLAVLLLVMLLAALIWRVFRLSDDINDKNDVIVREVRRNQALIHQSS